MNPFEITRLANELKRLNANYDAVVMERKAVPMDERRFRWKALQDRADLICNDIMRTERAIIKEVLK